MRRELAGLALLAVVTLSGCAAQAVAGPSPHDGAAKGTAAQTGATQHESPTGAHESPTRAAGGPPVSTLPPGTDSAAVEGVNNTPPCAPDVSACVRLSTKQAWLMANGVTQVGPVAITHGGTTNPTPTGTWPVAWKDEVHTSSIYGDSMPFSVFFAPGGIAFHQGRLDEDSHGCIRLDMGNAQTFFSTLQVGQLVQVVA
jgi:hypothetical protein